MAFLTGRNIQNLLPVFGLSEGLTSLRELINILPLTDIKLDASLRDEHLYYLINIFYDRNQRMDDRKRETKKSKDPFYSIPLTTTNTTDKIFAQLAPLLYAAAKSRGFPQNQLDIIIERFRLTQNVYTPAELAKLSPYTEIMRRIFEQNSAAIPEQIITGFNLTTPTPPLSEDQARAGVLVAAGAQVQAGVLALAARYLARHSSAPLLFTTPPAPGQILAAGPILARAEPKIQAVVLALATDYHINMAPDTDPASGVINILRNGGCLATAEPAVQTAFLAMAATHPNYVKHTLITTDPDPDAVTSAHTTDDRQAPAIAKNLLLGKEQANKIAAEIPAVQAILAAEGGILAVDGNKIYDAVLALITCSDQKIANQAHAAILSSARPQPGAPALTAADCISAAADRIRDAATKIAAAGVIPAYLAAKIQTIAAKIERAAAPTEHAGILDASGIVFSYTSSDNREIADTVAGIQSAATQLTTASPQEYADIVARTSISVSEPHHQRLFDAGCLVNANVQIPRILFDAEILADPVIAVNTRILTAAEAASHDTASTHSDTTALAFAHVALHQPIAASATIALTV